MSVTVCNVCAIDTCQIKAFYLLTYLINLLTNLLAVALLYKANELNWTEGKCKGRLLAIAPLTWVRLVTRSALQSRKWQLTGMSQWYRSALCGHPLPALADNWIHGLQLADIPPPQSATLGLHPVARKLLLISHPAEGRRLSCPEHTVG